VVPTFLVEGKKLRRTLRVAAEKRDMHSLSIIIVGEKKVSSTFMALVQTLTRGEGRKMERSRSCYSEEWRGQKYITK